ncbi:MAG TPA: ABC transporter permease subunit [Bacillota bacterium]|nr:ABC transporter permease subunit [Bacillota bacterium]
MHIQAIAIREMKMGFRNPWSYSFMALFSFFSLALLLINTQKFVQGFSSTTATMLNLILYLLPLMTLLLGSFSLTGEKEEGSWRLLSTYPISTASFINGKYVGLTFVLLFIISFGYGLTGVIGAMVGKPFDFITYGMFFVFSALLILLFLAIAILIGTLAKNRWQALTFCVGIWFFMIIGWPTVLVSFLGLLPYIWIKPVLIVLTMVNPAELVRLFIIVKLGGGSALGPEYYQWINWMNHPNGIFIFILVCVILVGISIFTATVLWERGRAHD